MKWASIIAKHIYSDAEKVENIRNSADEIAAIKAEVMNEASEICGTLNPVEISRATAIIRIYV